jgi:hypothetical protein
LAIYIGGNEITDIKIGSSDINSVWVGGTEVWSRNLGQSTVTVGRYNDGYVEYYGYSNLDSTFGSISGSTASFLNNATIQEIAFSYGYVTFVVSGTQNNSGWTNMDIAGTNFSRSSASYATASGKTYWSWIDNNPFGTTTGATKTVTWT